MDQVAEFATSELNTYQFAWVICYLAGLYKNSILNLEIQGGGQAVINEMRNLKRLATAMPGGYGKALTDVLSHMQYYLWRRNDSLGGISNSLGWLTTSQTKERMLNYFKDYFERGMLTVNSMDLLDEMKSITRDGSQIAAYGRGKDDRVMATGLACAAFAEQLQPRLIQGKLSRERQAPIEDKTADQMAYQRSVTDYLKRIGYGT